MSKNTTTPMATRTCVRYLGELGPSVGAWWSRSLPRQHRQPGRVPRMSNARRSDLCANVGPPIVTPASTCCLSPRSHSAKGPHHTRQVQQLRGGLPRDDACELHQLQRTTTFACRDDVPDHRPRGLVDVALRQGDALLPERHVQDRGRPLPRDHGPNLRERPPSPATPHRDAFAANLPPSSQPSLLRSIINWAR